MPETVARWHRRGLIARMARDNPGWGAERIRRELIHLNVTASPTAAWIRRQAIAATPWGRTPAYLVRDRDAVYGREFVEQARRLGMATVLTPLRRVTTAGLFAPATDTPRTRCPVVGSRADGDQSKRGEEPTVSSCSPSMLSRRSVLRRGALGSAAVLAGGPLLVACGAAPDPTATTAPAKPTTAPVALPTNAAASAPAATTAPVAAPTTAPAAAPTAAKPTAGGQAVTLKAVYWSAGPEDHDVFVATFKGFEKLNPDIKVEFNDVPSDQFVQVVTTMLAGGVPPDTMKTHAAWILGFITGKRLTDLTDMAKDVKGEYIPAQLDYLSYQGKIYGMPYYSGPSFVFYNKTMFNRKGLKTPDDHLKAGTWTWDTLRDLARQMTGGAGADRTFGWDAAMDWSNLQFYTCVPIWDDGGEITNKDETAWLLDSDQVVNVYQWHADMFLKEKSIPLPADMQGFNYYLKTGRVAMAWAGKFRANDLTNVEFDVGMIGTPKSKTGPINRDGPNASALPVGTKNVPQAYKLALYLGSADAAPYYLAGGASIPVKKALLDSPEFKKGLKPFEKAEVYAESASTLRAWRVPGKGAEAGRAFKAELDKVLVGQQDVRTALINAKTQMDPLIRG